MSDFFAEAIDVNEITSGNKSTAPIAQSSYSKEEEDFLKAKLPFLDPQHSSQIKPAHVSMLLRCSGLTPDAVQAVLKAAGVSDLAKTTTPPLSYDQMKRVFRAVSIAQSNSVPTQANILQFPTLNLKMPVFKDDDDDQDSPPRKAHHPPPATSTASKSNAKTQITKPNASDAFSAFGQPQQVTPTAQNIKKLTNFLALGSQNGLSVPITQNSNGDLNINHSQYSPFNVSIMQATAMPHLGKQMNPLAITSHPGGSSMAIPNQMTSTQYPSSRSSATSTVPPRGPPNEQLQRFSEHWAKLNTIQGIKISGSDVKAIYNHTASREDLSKAWKLCSKLQKGFLTKGEYFCFMNVVALKPVPSMLPEGLVKIAQTLDGPKNESAPIRDVKNKDVRESSQSKRLSQDLPKTSSIELIQKRSTQPVSGSLNPEGVRRTQAQWGPQNNELSRQVQSRVTGGLNAFNFSQVGQLKETINVSLNKQSSDSKEISQQFSNSLEQLQDIEAYMAGLQKKMQSSEKNLDHLKEVSSGVSNRLNGVCLKLKDTVTRQEGLISALFEHIQTKQVENNQRNQLLEAYLNKVYSEQDALIKRLQQLKAQPPKPLPSFKELSYTQNTPSNGQTEVEKISNSQRSLGSNVESMVVQVKPVEVAQSDESTQNQVPSNIQSPSSNHIKQSPVSNESPFTVSPQKPPMIEQVTAPSEPATQPATQPADPYQMQRMQLLQLLNFLTPISEQQMPSVIAKLNSMEPEQLTALFNNLYPQYLARVQSTTPVQDEFNTKQFEQNKSPTQNENDDFWND